MSQLNSQSQNQMQMQAKERASIATWVSSSETPYESPKTRESSPAKAVPYRSQLFENSIGTCQVSQKVHQRAVSWMITISWSKNYSQECLWSTLLLYYSFKAKRKLPKEDLQLTLLTCLSLALKMHSSKSHSTKELAALSSRSITPAAIVEREALILDLVQFNLVMPHQLEEIFLEGSCCQEELQTLMLVSELFMVKDCSIFFDRSKLKALVQLIRLDKESREEVQNWTEEMRKMKEEVKTLMNLKECNIILKKYSSKLDMEHFKTIFQ